MLTLSPLTHLSYHDGNADKTEVANAHRTDIQMSSLPEGGDSDSHINNFMRPCCLLKKIPEQAMSEQEAKTWFLDNITSSECEDAVSFSSTDLECDVFFFLPRHIICQRFLFVCNNNNPSISIAKRAY